MAILRRKNILQDEAHKLASEEPITARRLRKRNIVVLIPAYNEERFIGSMVLKLQSLPVTVVVVDDGSEDDTANLAERAGAIVVRQPENKGKAEALNAGFQVVQQLNPEVVVTIDGDLQHYPEELPRLVNPSSRIGLISLLVLAIWLKLQGFQDTEGLLICSLDILRTGFPELQSAIHKAVIELFHRRHVGICFTLKDLQWNLKCSLLLANIS
jgi:glycosyltransferase involved in cell wall biosynthesis